VNSERGRQQQYRDQELHDDRLRRLTGLWLTVTVAPPRRVRRPSLLVWAPEMRTRPTELRRGRARRGLLGGAPSALAVVAAAEASGAVVGCVVTASEPCAPFAVFVNEPSAFLAVAAGVESPAPVRRRPSSSSPQLCPPGAFRSASRAGARGCHLDDVS